MYAPRRVVIAAGAPFYYVGLHHRMPARVGRHIVDASAAAMRLPRGAVVAHTTLAGRPVERVTVGATERPRAILYLHGGGYTVGSPRLYRNLAAYLAQAADSVVWNLDYRMAPEHPYPAALDDAVAAVHALITEQGLEASRIAIAGDSAGGGLAVATARVLADQDVHVAALGLISPWTDPSDEDFQITRDRATNLRWGRRSAAAYRGSAAPDDPGYAPMHGRLDGLPPMLVHHGADEMIRPQIQRFIATARAAGADVTVIEDPRWWHSFHVMAGMLHDATDAVQNLGAFLRSHLDAPVRAS